MAKKDKKVEEAAGGESGSGRWMLTYLDMVTLLFGVFVIMYAMSSMDQQKAVQVAKALEEGFQGGMTIFRGPATGGQTILENLQPEGTNKKTLYEKMRKVNRKDIDRHNMTITETDRGVQISFVGDIFFESGSAEVTEDMSKSLFKIAPLLRDIEHPIVIAGHTDDIRVHKRGNEEREFKDNWELAAKRSINVLRILEDQGVEPTKMSIQSYGKYQPLTQVIKDPMKNTPQYRALNRRVDIIIETGTEIKKRKKLDFDRERP